jgi:hypothetical protein
MPKLESPAANDLTAMTCTRCGGSASIKSHSPASAWSGKAVRIFKCDNCDQQMVKWAAE